AAAELMRDPDVVTIHVVNERGTVFDYGPTPGRFHDELGAQHSLVEVGDLLIASGPIEIESLPIGRVTLAVSKRRLEAGMQLRNNVLGAAGLGGALALLLALAF